MYDSQLHSVRIRIEQLLISDPDFDAFCMDYFPLIYCRYTIGMERVVKTNLLLEHGDLDAIIGSLDNYMKHKQRKVETIAVYSTDLDKRTMPKMVRAEKPKGVALILRS